MSVFLTSLFLVFQAQAVSIQEVKSWDEVLESVDKINPEKRKKTAFGFDVDDTLILNGSWSPLYPDAFQWIRENFSRTFICTARPNNSHEQTVQELKSFALEFDEHYYTNNCMKGATVVKALSHKKEESLVFVDDRSNQLQSIADAFSGLPIELHLFLYSPQKNLTTLSKGMSISYPFMPSISPKSIPLPKYVLGDKADVDVPTPPFEIKEVNYQTMVPVHVYKAWLDVYQTNNSLQNNPQGSIVYTSIRTNRMRDLLSNYFTTIDDKKPSSMSASDVIQHSLFEHFVARNTICASILNLDDPKTYKTYFPIGFLVKVPPECIYKTKENDAATVMEGGVTQSELRKQLETRPVCSHEVRKLQDAFNFLACEEDGEEVPYHLKSFTFASPEEREQYASMFKEYYDYVDQYRKKHRRSYDYKTREEFFGLESKKDQQLGYKTDLTPHDMMYSSSSVLYNELNFVPRVKINDTVKEVSIVGFAYDSSKLQGNKQFFENEKISSKDYLNCVLNVADKFKLPAIDLSKLREEKK